MKGDWEPPVGEQRERGIREPAGNPMPVMLARDEVVLPSWPRMRLSMRTGVMKKVLIGSISLVLLASAAGFAAKPAGKPVPPAARKIPGITAEDTHPKACLDCHVNHPEMNLDARLSTIVGGFTKQVGAKMLAKAKAAAADPSKIKGRHPSVDTAFKDVPNTCRNCHRREFQAAPPFVRLMHIIHLVGGQGNHFMTFYQGECTLCHKLDQTTGAWSIPSGAEK